MTALNDAIRHYKKLVKKSTGNQAHYALGVLDTLEQVKEIRDGYREEEKRLWHGRAHPSVMAGYQYTKSFRSALDKTIHALTFSTNRRNEMKFQPTLNPICTEVRNVLQGTARRNITVETTTENSRRKDVSEGRYSRNCPYPKIRHDIYVHSCFAIRGQYLYLSYDWVASDRLVRHESILTAPKGWRWTSDSNGIVLHKVGTVDCDYHPTGGELHHAQYHEEQRLDEENFERMLPHIKVTLHDSLAGGNCRQGTLQFAQAHGLLPQGENPDTYSGVRADVLMRFSGSTGRVRAAVIAAYQRQTTVSI
jgi:hypothetical protein